MNWIQYQDLVSMDEMERLAKQLHLPKNTGKWTTQEMIGYDMVVTLYRINKLKKVGTK